MKILCVIDSFAKGGGAQTQLAGLASMLSAKGHDVTAFSYHALSCKELSWQSELENSGVRWILYCKARTMLHKYKAIKQAIKVTNAEVVVAYINGPTTICCLLKLFEKLKFRLIVSERNTSQNISIREYIKYQLYRLADVVVPNAYAQDKFLKENFIFLSKKTKVISNFVDTEKYTQRMESESGVSETFRILSVGRINEQKNVLRFITTLSLLKQRGIRVSVDWFGLKTKDKYSEECFALIKDLNLQDSIRLLPAVGNINEKYQNSEYEAFCLPSLFEGCPNALMEAMSCGLPVLVGSVCDNELYVDNEKGGFLFDPNDTNDIANSIERMIKTTKKERKAMGKHNAEIARLKLSKEAFVEKYLKIIN